MHKILLTAALATLLARTASAATVLYDNFTGLAGALVTGTQTIQSPYYSVANSFTLNSAATGLSANIWMWEWESTDPLVSLQWAIVSGAPSDNPYTDPVVASGTASSFTSTFLGTILGPVQTTYYQYKDGFSLVSGLAAGNYWLILGQGETTSPTGLPIFWDESNGPSAAWEDNIGTDVNLSTSESFQIVGTATASVPEPGTLALIGVGLLTLAGVGRRRSKR
jgi:hypothetical protein